MLNKNCIEYHAVSIFGEFQAVAMTIGYGLFILAVNLGTFRISKVSDKKITSKPRSILSSPSNQITLIR